MTHYEVAIAAAAAGLAALIYIGRQVRSAAALVTMLAQLPAEHQQLIVATAANTAAISALTAQLSALTADVALVIRK